MVTVALLAIQSDTVALTVCSHRVLSCCVDRPTCGLIYVIHINGKIEGKRSRSRQRIYIQYGISAWLGRSTAEMFVDARDRKKGKVMIACPSATDTTTEEEYTSM